MPLERAAFAPVDVALIAEATRGLRLRAQRIKSPDRGAHTLRRRGDTLSFFEHRAYLPGDDLRRLDHRLSARHGAPFVKTFEDERAMGFEVVIDTTASMGFGNRHPTYRTKLLRAFELAVALAALAHKSAEAIGLVLVGPEPRRLLSAKTRAKQVDTFVQALRAVETTASGDWALALSQAVPKLKAGGHVLLLTDAVVDPLAYQQALFRLGGASRRVSVVQLTHPWERELLQDPQGGLELVDLESAGRTLVSPQMQKTFLSRHTTWLQTCAHLTHMAHAQHLVQDTDTQLREATLALLRAFALL